MSPIVTHGFRREGMTSLTGNIGPQYSARPPDSLTARPGAGSLKWMNLARMRRWSRVLAVILLIAAGRGLAHFAQDDPGCTPGVIQPYGTHQQSDHALAEALRADHQNHCAVC